MVAGNRYRIKHPAHNRPSAVRASFIHYPTAELSGKDGYSRLSGDTALAPLNLVTCQACFIAFIVVSVYLCMCSTLTTR